jgi:hypothetical protein
VSLTVCLAGANLRSPVGGHLWVQLNWALALRALGCRVIWLEVNRLHAASRALRERAAALQRELDDFGLGSSLAFDPALDGYLDLAAAAEAEVLLDLCYCSEVRLVGRFGRSALIDIDPGLTQCWLAEGQMTVAPHDVYFTIGETVGTPDARVPDCGLTWHYTPPPVFLPAWPPTRGGAQAPYTTISSWWGPWVLSGGETYANDKRTSFLEYLELPSRSPRRLELALALGGHAEERCLIERHGWAVREASTISASARQYRDYIQASRGEFSCAKPSCMRLGTAWISDRTICYLASGKPAIVQYTGRSRFLPDADGLFRFRTLDEAAAALETVEADYERHARAARGLAEAHFDAIKVVAAVLDRVRA